MGPYVVATFFNLCVNCVRRGCRYYFAGCTKRGNVRTKTAGAIFHVSYTGIISFCICFVLSSTVYSAEVLCRV